MNPTFSIIIPVYNVIAELPRAVKSVQSQTSDNWEIVLVDDGSTDGSGLLCDQLAAEDARLKVIHQSNKGVVSARQCGFFASSGEWILFLDGDDELAPDILALLSDTVARCATDIIRFGFVMIRRGGGRQEYLPPALPSEKLKALMPLVRSTPLELTGTCIGDKLYRRSIVSAAFDAVGDLAIKHSEDGLFALAAVLNASTLATIPLVGYRYNLRAGSAVHRFNIDLAHEMDVFIGRAVAMVESSPYASDSLVDKMKIHHSYEALGFLYSCVLRWHGTKEQVAALLTSARETQFIKNAKPRLSSLPRRVKAFLVCHPKIMIPYRFFFRCRRRDICD